MQPPPILLEACVDSLDAALAAEQAGADRIELCSALELGGLTPSAGLIRSVLDRLEIPVQVLLRPRPGNFVYSPAELKVMCINAGLVSRSNAAGIVTGALTAEGGLAREDLQRIMAAANGTPLTFHRAFDHAHDPRIAARQLIDLGVKRILSSGQKETALAGSGLLAELQREFGGEIAIMPGGGITVENIAQLAKETGCREFHFSAIRLLQHPPTGPEVGKSAWGNAHFVADPDKVRAIRAALQG